MENVLFAPTINFCKSFLEFLSQRSFGLIFNFIFLLVHNTTLVISIRGQGHGCETTQKMRVDFIYLIAFLVDNFFRACCSVHFLFLLHFNLAFFQCGLMLSLNICKHFAMWMSCHGTTPTFPSLVIAG